MKNILQESYSFVLLPRLTLEVYEVVQVLIKSKRRTTKNQIVQMG